MIFTDLFENTDQPSRVKFQGTDHDIGDEQNIDTRWSDKMKSEFPTQREFNNGMDRLQSYIVKLSSSKIKNKIPRADLIKKYFIQAQNNLNVGWPDFPESYAKGYYTNLRAGSDLMNVHGIAEGHADQQRKIVKRNGQAVGEVGIDRESSPGVGQYYMKHYASGTDNSGYDSREEALDDLRHIMKQSVYGELQGQGVEEGTDVTDYNPKSKGGTRKELIAKYHKTKNPKDAEAARKAGATQKELQGVAEAMKPSDIPPSMRDRLTMRDIEAERSQGAFRFRVTFPDGHANDYMTFDAAKSAAERAKGRITRLSETQKTQARGGRAGNPRIDRILKMLRANHPQAQNDLEALILDFRGQQAQDRSDIARLDAENAAEEEDIARLERMLAILKQRGQLAERVAKKKDLGLRVARDQDENIVVAEAKRDACYNKVKSRYKVWPSAYASGALVQCRKKGAANWGIGGKKK